MMFPASVEKQAQVPAMISLFLAPLLRRICFRPSCASSCRSKSSVSHISLYCSCTSSSVSSPRAFASAREVSASSRRPWLTSQRGLSGRNGRMAMQAREKTPWIRLGSLHDQFPLMSCVPKVTPAATRPPT